MVHVLGMFVNGRDGKIFPPHLSMAGFVFKHDQAAIEGNVTVANPHQVSAFTVNVVPKRAQYLGQTIQLRRCQRTAALCPALKFKTAYVVRGIAYFYERQMRRSRIAAVETKLAVGASQIESVHVPFF